MQFIENDKRNYFKLVVNKSFGCIINYTQRNVSFSSHR